jgi:sugar lactone lactonase YvrE
MGNGRILSYHLQVKKVMEIVSLDREGMIPKKPLAITSNDKNDLFITDAICNCLFRYTNNRWEKLSQPDTISYDLPGSVACDDNGSVYFTDFLHNRICFLETASDKVSVIETIDCVKPYGISINNNILYITDTARGRIQWYNIQTREQGILLEGSFAPIAITADMDGDIYFSESKKLYLYHKNTKQVETIIDSDIWRSKLNKKLYHLGAMAVLSEGQIVCTDTVKNSIFIINIQKSPRNKM